MPRTFGSKYALIWMILHNNTLRNKPLYLKYLVIIAGFLLVANNAVSQRNFIVFDTTMVNGVRLVAERNPDVVYVNNRDGSVDTYNPDEVSLFQVDGRLYRSMNLEGIDEKVFVENSFEGKLTVFRYNGKGKKLFFIEKDGAMTRLQSDDFREKLVELTPDCGEISKQTRLVRFGQKSIAEFASRYENCELKPFPHFRWGVIAGMESTWLRLKESVYRGPTNLTGGALLSGNFRLDPNISLVAGLFVDMPIFTNEVSLNLSALFARNTFEQFTGTGSINIELSSIDYLILIRHTQARNKLRPYANWGYRFSHNFQIESTFNSAIPAKDQLISDLMGGVHVAGGLQYDIAVRQKLNFELAYSYLFTKVAHFRKTNLALTVALVL